MRLLIDLGNSRLKWWLYGPDALLAEGEQASDAEWQGWAGTTARTNWSDESSRGSQPTIRSIGLCSVASAETTEAVSQRLLAQCALAAPDARPPHMHRLASGDQAPGLSLDSDYRLDQLGPDRWAAGLGLLAWWSDNASLRPPPAGPARVALVSAGTATVVDFYDLVPGASQPRARLLGGHLLPGWQLMTQSLLGGTARIAAVMDGPPSMESESVWPRSTEAAVASGLAAAQLGPLALADRPDALIVHGGGAQAFLDAYGQRLGPRWNLAALHEPRLIGLGLRAWSESF